MAEWSPLSRASDSMLRVRDLHAVFHAVHTIRARWNLLATLLGLTPDTVAAVRTNCSDVDGCLREILLHWLRRNYDTEENGHPSWRRLCLAVADPAGGENKALAEEIAIQHPTTTEVSKPVAAPVDERGYIQPFGCGCGGCTISSIIKGCPHPDEDEKVPILKVSCTHPLAKNHSEAKQWELEEKTREIQKKFAECIRKTAHFLHARNVKISEIEDYLAPFQNADELGKFDSINKLLGFLNRKRWLSWFNYDLLEDLINEFLQGVFSLEPYKEAFKEYASGRVEEYEGVQFGLPAKPGQHKVLLLKIDSGYKELKLNDIPSLRSSICRILKQRYTLLYLVTLHCSSITLEFLMPLHLCTNLFPLSQKQLTELAQIGVNAVETDVFKATNLIQQKTSAIPTSFSHCWLPAGSEFSKRSISMEHIHSGSMLHKIRSIEFTPRFTTLDGEDPSGLQVLVKRTGEQGSYLKMEKYGHLSLAAGDANLRENVYKFDMQYQDDGRVKMTSCAYAHNITAHPSKLTVDGIFVESDSEELWYVETAAEGDKSRKRMYVKNNDDQKMYFYISYNDGGYHFRLGRESDVVVKNTNIFKFHK